MRRRRLAFFVFLELLLQFHYSVSLLVEKENPVKMMMMKNVENLGAVKVMTDEQMEMLRKQISVYATICDRLVQMHKSLSAQQDLFPGFRLGNPYGDPSLSSIHKIPARQRWTPKPEQLHILEHIFEQCNATPSRQRIKEITNDLVQHGQITESNVYNWFQNRRARSKRKQPALATNNQDSEVETEPESVKDTMSKPEDFLADESSAFIAADQMYCRSPGIGMELEHPGNYSFSPYWQYD